MVQMRLQRVDEQETLMPDGRSAWVIGACSDNYRQAGGTHKSCWSLQLEELGTVSNRAAIMPSSQRCLLCKTNRPHRVLGIISRSI